MSTPILYLNKYIKFVLNAFNNFLFFILIKIYKSLHVNNSMIFYNIITRITGFFVYKNIVGCCLIVTANNYKVISI
jgi:hypothetical protein